MTYKLGIIGIGVMGQAILSGIIKKNILNSSEIALFDISTDKLKEFETQGFTTYNSAQKLVDNCEYILFSVKPQHYESITSSVRFTADNSIISIMAGVKIDTLKKKININCPIARVMPNTPCKIGSGVCAVCFDGVSTQNQSFVKSLLGTCGQVVDIDEKFFDAVTSISGSGPAYVYMFIDGLIKGGIEGGLSFEQSKTLAINTVIGTAKLALDSDEELSVLTEKVCSKGGTTIEAVNIYKNEGLEELLIKGITACRNRSEELGKQL